jgi:hypothetical protein
MAEMMSLNPMMALQMQGIQQASVSMTGLGEGGTLIDWSEPMNGRVKAAG